MTSTEQTSSRTQSGHTGGIQNIAGVVTGALMLLFLVSVVYVLISSF